METGDLSEWSGADNSGSAMSTAVTAFSAGIPPKSGKWVMKQSVTGSVGGARMQRFPEIDALSKAGTTFYMSWWDYYPVKITFGPSDMFSTFQVCSQDANGVFDPIWGLFLNGTDGTLTLGWSPNGTAPAEGPHAGEFGRRAWTSTLPVPVGQWVFFEVMIKPAADFTGAFKLWMNHQVVFDQSLVKTRFPDTSLGGFQYTQITAYGSGLTPTPASHYVDDVTISLSRMPYP
jgi:Polysaccharide lyase